MERGMLHGTPTIHVDWDIRDALGNVVAKRRGANLVINDNVSEHMAKAIISRWGKRSNRPIVISYKGNRTYKQI